MKTKLFLFTLPLLGGLLLSGCKATNNSPSTPTIKNFDNAIFASETVNYDGSSHILKEVSGVPEGTTVTYTGREYFSDVGTYDATALLKKDGYNDKTLNATLTIKGMPITGVSLNNQTFTYDGQPHSLEVEGTIPSGVTVAYSDNSRTDVGSQTVTATLQGSNYETLKLTATLTIQGRTITGVTLESQSFVYDGQPHSLEVEGTIPSGVTVTYSNNSRTDVGSQTVTATLKGTGYEELKLTATLTIQGRTITGVTLKSKTFVYDGQPHSLAVTGDIPEGVTVTYSNNSRTNIGSQTVTATLQGGNYETLKLTATLAISQAEVENPGNFYSKTFFYDGNYHSIEVENPPYGATITYKCLNASGTNRFKEIGFYIIEATVKINSSQFSILTATLSIIEPATYGVDPSKTPLNIDNNLTWDNLYSAMDKNNFTMKRYTGHYDTANLDDPLPEKLFDDDFAHDDRTIVAIDENQAVVENVSFDDEEGDSLYFDYYIEHNEDIIHMDFNMEYSTIFEKFPKAAFKETIGQYYASYAFSALQKGENGEFNPGVDLDDYYSDIGTAYIEDGVFTVLMSHPRTLSAGGYRYFYRIYSFYNVGNTTLNISEKCLPTENYIQGLYIEDFYLNGVKYGYSYFGNYSNMKEYFSAELYVSNSRAIFLPSGTYTVLPAIYGKAIEAIVFTSSYYTYNYHQGLYTFNLYVDEDGFYQGEYADYGELKKLDISTFTSRGGTINYYDDWH